MQIIVKNKWLFENFKQIIIFAKNRDHYAYRSLNSYTNSQNDWQRRDRDRQTQRRGAANSHPYRKLYPWHSLSEFVSVLHSSVIYNDGELIGVCKPWGVGIYKAEQTINNKNAQLLHGVYSGSPKYCVTDALEMLAQKLGINSRLQIVKSIERFMSGVILLSTNDKTKDRINRSLSIARVESIPFSKYWCITKGWPVFDGPFLKEKVGIKMVETDEFGDYMEPIIIESNKLTKRMRRGYSMSDGKAVISVLTDMRMLECNKSISASLVELNVSNTKFHFIQCYMANKASFILGDTRYPRRVKNILGVPMSTKKAHLSFDDSYEPLTTEFCDKIFVKGNNYIPLMAHHKSITLPRFRKKETIVIDSPIVPKYFTWTLDKLGMKCASYTSNKDIETESSADTPYEEYNKSVLNQYVKINRNKQT